ncbi:NAD-dependent epimerase/dehydratase family protein [Erythrobacter pelagi]|uniref:NAD-dependent epimerase/dehydratase family protein n=1 Tax=Qipengyuania pelagi TaxID=994320 RepID=A0A844YA07_9SPHN|nr:NAD-dependent epimerase/dehydratase family protein [Qipengyuania pelagi]
MKATRGLWLVTGAAGFIGSNIVETLLQLGQNVRAIDNFATGHAKNLAEVRRMVGEDSWSRFEFIEGDIRDPDTCRAACREVSYVLHQAALGSVPRSLDDPLTTNEVNVSGFLNMIDAARREGSGVRFVYAASSSTYGDEPNLPKIEDRIGRPLSPYAATKAFNEVYADVFRRSYDQKAIGLRYFNVFGPRQDPNGAYAAVIPLWVKAMIEGAGVRINGDGETSRDFCFVTNAVQANIRAALAPDEAWGEVYNVAVGQRTSLIDLHGAIAQTLSELGVSASDTVVHGPARPGDVRHSLAHIGKAGRLLGYRPTHDLRTGLRDAMPWYIDLVSKEAE